jgi:hypothetical protein
VLSRCGAQKTPRSSMPPTLPAHPPPLPPAPCGCH